jgi:PadR family transcriptional regulator PadR
MPDLRLKVEDRIIAGDKVVARNTYSATHDMIALAALSSGPAHGYAVIEEIKRRSGEAFDLPEGTIYPVLHRLEQAQLLASRWVTAESGRRRRVYALSKRGQRALVGQRVIREQFSVAIGALLAGTRAGGSGA